MPTYLLEFTRTIQTTVTVTADSKHEALLKSVRQLPGSVNMVGGWELAKATIIPPERPRYEVGDIVRTGSGQILCLVGERTSQNVVRPSRWIDCSTGMAPRPGSSPEMADDCTLLMRNGQVRTTDQEGEQA